MSETSGTFLKSEIGSRYPSANIYSTTPYITRYTKRSRTTTDTSHRTSSIDCLPLVKYEMSGVVQLDKRSDHRFASTSNWRNNVFYGSVLTNRKRDKRGIQLYFLVTKKKQRELKKLESFHKTVRGGEYPVLDGPFSTVDDHPYHQSWARWSWKRGNPSDEHGFHDNEGGKTPSPKTYLFLSFGMGISEWQPLGQDLLVRGSWCVTPNLSVLILGRKRVEEYLPPSLLSPINPSPKNLDTNVTKLQWKYLLPP